MRAKYHVSMSASLSAFILHTCIYQEDLTFGGARRARLSLIYEGQAPRPLTGFKIFVNEQNADARERLQELAQAAGATLIAGHSMWDTRQDLNDASTTAVRKRTPQAAIAFGVL